MKINYIALADDGSSFYRAQGVLPYIEGCTDISHLNWTSWSCYVGCDVLIFQRPYNEVHLSVLKMAKQMGVRVIVDYDDDLLNIPPHHPAYAVYDGHKVRECIAIADEVWVSTSGIRESFGVGIVIPNAHNDYLMPVSGKKEFNWDNRTVLYRGGETHYLDLKHVTPMLTGIAKANPSWNFVFMGMIDNEHFIDDMSDCDNVSVTNGVPMMQYLDEIGKINAPIAICPLDDTLLNRGKSNCSWLEATYAGSAYFRNSVLPSIPFGGVMSFSLLGRAISEGHATTLRKSNEESWSYICDNLLLSNVNKLRIERLNK